MKQKILNPIKAFFNKIVAGLLLFSFSILFFSAPVAAQIQPAPVLTQKSVTQTNQTTTNTSTTPTSKLVTATTSGSLENGQVLFCVPGLGAVCDFFENLFAKLAELCLRAFYYFIRILGTPFGQSSKAACTGDPNCTQAMRKIDPFYDAGAYVEKTNLFTIADAGFNQVYTTAPKINSATYLVDDFNQNVLGVKVANAQSLGQDSFGPTLKQIWKKFQDLSYIVMVVVLVVIGFMVMLRRRLDPRTVVTATNALPRVVVALIMITFSFAISGLFIDFIHLSISIVREYMSGVGGHFSDVFAKLGVNAGGELIWLPFFTLISKSILQLRAIAVLFETAGFLFFLPGPDFIPILILIGIFALDLIIRIFMLVLAAMLFWSLVTRFVTLIVLTIFSPVFFLFGAVPGYEGVMTTWFKRMAAAALCFPIMLVLIYVAVALVAPFNDNAQIAAPPPIGETGKIFNIGVLVGVGILMFTQKVPGFVDDMLGIKPGGGSGRGGGGIGLGAAITAPLAGASMLSTANRSAGALAALTGNAVAKRGVIGAIATPFHNALRFAAGGAEFDSTGLPNKNRIRSAQQIRDNQWNKYTAEKGVVRGMRDEKLESANAVRTAKEFAQEHYVTNFLAANPGKTRDDAMGQYTRDAQSAIATNYPHHPVNLAPNRSAADAVNAANKLIDDEIDRIKAATPAISQGDLNQKIADFTKNGYR